MQPAQQQEAAPVERPDFHSLCNDSSLFNDFGHFSSADPGYAGSEVAFKPVPKTSVIFTLRLPEDVFDIYDFSTNL